MTNNKPADGLPARKYKLGDRVTKTKGSSWTGLVVGFYSTALTPVGYAVESETEKGSVQIYPEAALSLATPRMDDGELAMLKTSIDEVVAEKEGFWASCSGCHETVDGYSSAPHSKLFGCYLGIGCRECGGIGAIWDNTDYEDMAKSMQEYDRESLAHPSADAPRGDKAKALAKARDCIVGYDNVKEEKAYCCYFTEQEYNTVCSALQSCQPAATATEGAVNEQF